MPKCVALYGYLWPPMGPVRLAVRILRASRPKHRQSLGASGNRRARAACPKKMRLAAPRRTPWGNAVEGFGKSQGWIGASIRRKEDGRLLTGAGTYVDD